VKDREKYDSLTCITAEEIRALGASLPESIPNCAWIPRASVELVVGEVEAATGSGGHDG
jgi:hypothetical protein